MLFDEYIFDILICTVNHGFNYSVLSFLGQYTWVFTESNISLEISLTCSDCQAHRAYIQSTIFGKFKIFQTFLL